MLLKPRSEEEVKKDHVSIKDNWEDHSITMTMEKSEMKVKIAHSCQTLCDPMYYIIHGILQAAILEWVAVPFSRVSSQPRDQTEVSHIADRFFTS